jgi:hypothetical protein
MSFQKDFHGGRSYAPDPFRKRRPGLSASASLVIAWIKLRLSRLTPGASSVPEGLSRRKGEGFSLLGSDERHGQVRELDTKVFPIASSTASYRRGS